MTRDGSTALLGAGAGLLFVVLNAGRLGSGWSPVAEVAALIAFVGLALMLRQQNDSVPPSTAASRKARRIYVGTVCAAVTVVYLGAQLLARTSHFRYVLPFIFVVAGVHFVVFAAVFRAPSYLSQAGTLLLVGAVGFSLVSLSNEQGAALTGTLAGTTLLALAVVPLLRSPRDLPER